MDRDAKRRLAELLTGLDEAVVVATHDPEFAAAFARRVILLADGAVIADASAGEVLSGGTYFVTETARILSGLDGALTPAEGAAALQRARAGTEAVV
jgi:energy-coupling factor transport system ATP-binding protein